MGYLTRAEATQQLMKEYRRNHDRLSYEHAKGVAEVLEGLLLKEYVSIKAGGRTILAHMAGDGEGRIRVTRKGNSPILLTDGVMQIPLERVSITYLTKKQFKSRQKMNRNAMLAETRDETYVENPANERDGIYALHSTALEHFNPPQSLYNILTSESQPRKPTRVRGRYAAVSLGR